MLGNSVQLTILYKIIYISLHKNTLAFMSSNIIEGDSLLSNISNISVKIEHNRSDGSGILKNFIQQNQNQKQIPIDDLEDYESLNHESLLDKILFKRKQHANDHELQNTWVTGRVDPGVSEQEDQSQHISQSQLPIRLCEQELPNSKDQMVNETQQIKREKLLLEKRLKNQTKNIPKNYGKAIITFIEKYQDKVKKITEENGVDYEDFLEQLKQKKKVINTIADLRNMWVDYKYAKCMRLLSNLFLRKYALTYIFNSRICNFGSHIKYRYRLCEAIKEPYTFKHIKDY